MTYFLLLFISIFSFSFSEIAYSIDGVDYSENSFFSKIPKEEWNGFSNSQKNSLLKDFIYKELVYIESKKSNFLYDPFISKKLDDRINQFLINVAYDVFVAFPLVDSVDYNKTLKNLKKDIKVKHLLVGYQGCRLPFPIKRDKKNAFVLATNLYNDLLSGSNFNDYVSKFSDDPSANKNFGDLGWLSWGRTVPEFQNIAFSLDINDFSEPVLTDFGYHIILLEKTRPSNASLLDSLEYKALALEKSIVAIPIEKKRVSAKKYDEKMLLDAGLVFNESYLLKLFSHITNERNKNKIIASGKKNLISTLNSFNESGIVCVFDSSGYGVRWFSNHFDKFPATRIPSIKSLDDLKNSFSLAILQSLNLSKINKNYNSFDYLFESKIASISKNLIFDSFVKYQINNIDDIDSLSISSYYETNKKEKYIEYDLVEVREIKTLSKQTSDSLYNLLLNNFSFSDLAKSNSLTNPRQGGLINPFTKNRYGPMGKQAHLLKTNTFSSPIENLDGTWSIIYVENKIDKQYIPLSRVRTKIKNLLKKDLQKTTKENLYLSLYDKYNVLINPLFYKDEN